MTGRTRELRQQAEEFVDKAKDIVSQQKEQLSAALEVASGDALRRNAGDIAVIGGGDIYAELLPLATRLEITYVHARPEGETLFPSIDPALWRETARRECPAGPDDEASYEFVTFVRR